MKYRNSIIALGFLVIIIQFLGFPQSMRDVFYIIVGISIIVLSYLCKHDGGKKSVDVGGATSNRS